MKEFVNKRLWKALLVGGPMAIGMLLSLVAFVGMYGNDDRYEAWQLAIALIAFLVFLVGTVWSTGFWGRWGVLVFFALAPAIVIIDFAVNPFAPAGSILFAGLFILTSSS